MHSSPIIHTSVKLNLTFFNMQKMIMKVHRLTNKIPFISKDLLGSWKAENVFS